MRVTGRGNAKGGGGSGLRRLLALVTLVAGASVIVLFWPWVSAQARAVVVLSAVLKTPVLTPVVEGLTGEPRVEDRAVAGNPALVARPGGEGPWPVVLFVNGTIPEGRKLPEVRRLAEGIARAGYLVVVPDLPGLRSDAISPQTVAETVEVARAVSEGPGVHGGEVGLVGVSTGATLAILAAEDPALGGRVSVVCGVAPYADIRTVLDVATTGHYHRDGEPVRYTADPFLSYVSARSLISTLPSGEDRQVLLSELEGVDRDDPEPLADLRVDPPENLGPGARSVVALLENEDPERFDDRYEELPDETREDLEKLSPLAGEERVEAPVELASEPRDRYFPLAESRAIVRRAPDARLTVTPALSHANPEPSLRDLPALARLDGFVVRSLRLASRGPDEGP